MHTHTHVHIYRERGREKEMVDSLNPSSVLVYLFFPLIFIIIYICIYSMDWSRVVSCHLLFSPFSLYIIKQKAVDNTRALNWWTSVSFSSYDGCDSLRRPILGTMPISSLLLWAIYSGQEEQITSNFSVYTAYSFEMGDKWQYSYCFVGCCFQDFFQTVRSTLV